MPCWDLGSWRMNWKMTSWEGSRVCLIPNQPVRNLVATEKFTTYPAMLVEVNEFLASHLCSRVIDVFIQQNRYKFLTKY